MSIVVYDAFYFLNEWRATLGWADSAVQNDFAKYDDVDVGQNINHFVFFERVAQITLLSCLPRYVLQ